MKNLILIIDGLPNSGKDTFYKNIKFSMCDNKNVIFNTISTVDYIKEIAKEHFAWDGIKDEKGRKLISDLKQASMEYNLQPFNKVINKIDDFINMYEKTNIIYVVHSREPEDISRFGTYYRDNFITVLIKSNRSKRFENDSDLPAKIASYPYDYVLENNGSLEDFKKECDEFIKNIYNEYIFQRPQTKFMKFLEEKEIITFDRSEFHDGNYRTVYFINDDVRAIITKRPEFDNELIVHIINEYYDMNNKFMHYLIYPVDYKNPYYYFTAKDENEFREAISIYEEMDYDR